MPIVRYCSTNSIPDIINPCSLVALNPLFVTGFSDGEGCFSVSFSKKINKEKKIFWEIRPDYTIHLHKRDHTILEKLKSFFGVGNIRINRIDNSALYSVRSVSELSYVVIPHFDKYCLLTQKRADFLMFKWIVELMKEKKHLSSAGLQDIVNIRASMNNALSLTLKTAFPNTIPAPRPLIIGQIIKDPFWLSGFTGAEGCFFVSIHKDSKYNSGAKLQLRFTLTQHIRDIELMNSIINFFNCGVVTIRSNGAAVDYSVKKLSDLTEKIIPFFKKYPFQGVKVKDFENFSQIADLMNNKAHLTSEGLKKINVIKARINKGNILSDKTEKISQLTKQNILGQICSKETKVLVGKKHVNPIYVYEKDSGEFSLIGNFVSIRKAANFLDISPGTVTRYVQSGKIFKDRYRFSIR